MELYKIDKPRINWTDIIAGALIYLGFLLFLVALHILAINSSGNTQEVLNNVFSTFTYIYGFATIIAVSGVLIHIIRFAAWQVNTPNWKKKGGF